MIVVGVNYAQNFSHLRRQQQKSSAPTANEGLDIYPNTYWSHINLPNLTGQEKLKLAVENKKQCQRFVNLINKQARTLSKNLEDYIKNWLAGNASAKLPKGLLPPYIDDEKTKTGRLKSQTR